MTTYFAATAVYDESRRTKQQLSLEGYLWAQVLMCSFQSSLDTAFAELMLILHFPFLHFPATGCVSHCPWPLTYSPNSNFVLYKLQIIRWSAASNELCAVARVQYVTDSTRCDRPAVTNCLWQVMLAVVKWMLNHCLEWDKWVLNERTYPTPDSGLTHLFPRLMRAAVA